jgi:DNA-binding response OmpR family regulator
MISQGKMHDMATALIVEDDEAISDTLALVFTEEGFQVRTARNGEEALEMLKHAPGSIVLLDVMLPKLDGFGVIQALEAAQQLDHHQIVLMTAGPQSPRIQDLLRAGKVAAFLRKPFELDELVTLMQQLAHSA